jgi:CheY-like chemotaxis protein
VVTDSGVGISPEFLPHIFELFTQNNPGTYDQPGLGIGLSLARQLVEMHGGTITGYSKGSGLGSAFTIEIPIRSFSGSASTTPPAAHGRTSGRRVLIVDDNEDAANAIARLLRIMGNECRVAFNGEAGLHEFSVFQPDLVILDLTMPTMGGCEVCRRIRRLAADQVTIVALTGWGQQSYSQETERAGFDHLLVKPVDAETLERALALTPSPSPAPIQRTAI